MRTTAATVRLLLGVVLCGGLSACWFEPQVAVAPPVVQKDAVVGAPLDAVWDAAVEWFATHNLPIKNIDKASGLITTERSMSVADASRYMGCGQSETTGEGKVELVDHTGTFNLVVRAEGDASTRVTVNAFFACKVNTYKYASILSTDLVLVSSERKDCPSTGQLEKEIFDALALVKSAAPVASPVEPSPSAAAVPSATAAPALAGACASDSDCRAGRVCRAGACATPSCSKDIDCPEPQVCEASVCTAPPAPSK